MKLVLLFISFNKKAKSTPHQEGPKGNSESKSYAGSLILVKYSFSYL